MSIFDSPGIEVFITENNPKYAIRIIRQSKAKSFDKNYNPYAAAYSSMPFHVSTNSKIKQLLLMVTSVMSSNLALLLTG